MNLKETRACRMMEEDCNIDDWDPTDLTQQVRFSTMDPRTYTLDSRPSTLNPTPTPQASSARAKREHFQTL